MTGPALTGRQAEMLDLIRRHIAKRGYAPTLRELGALMGVRSTNGVNDHLKQLERKGYIRRDTVTARGIVVLGADGRCGACGQPLPAAAPEVAS